MSPVVNGGGANESSSSPCSATSYDQHTPFVAFNSALLGLSLLLGASGNLLVCWVVFRNKTLLRTANNVLLVNLAACDLIKCLVDTPLFIVTLLPWREKELLLLSSRLCCLLQFTFALCSCVQLLSLVGISVERFRAVAFPFKPEARKGRVRLWLLIIWVLGLALAGLSLGLSKDARYYMMCTHVRKLQRNYDTEPTGGPRPGHADPFGAFVLLPVWGCSLLLIAFHYARIFVVVRQHSNKIFDRGIQLTHSLSVSRRVSGWHSLSQHHAQRTSGSTLSKPPCARRPREDPVPSPSSPPEEQYHEEESNNKSSVTQIVGAVCILTPTAKELGQKRLEGQLAKRFGSIIIAILLFWLPLVMCLILDTHTQAYKDWLFSELRTSALVLTCVPAAIHPLIYSLLNRQFRAEFHRTLSALRTCTCTCARRPG